MSGCNNKSFFDEWRDASLWEVIKQRCTAFFKISDAVRNDVAEVDEDAVPLCPNCLNPLDPADHFCTKCGAPEGQYTNCMPFERILSLGWCLRQGTNPENKIDPSKRTSFVFLSLAAYGFLAPLYWIQMYRANRKREANIED